MTRTVLVGSPLPDAAIAVLKAQGDVIIDQQQGAAPDVFSAHLRNCDGVILSLQPVTAELVEKAQRLRVVSRFGVGYNNVDVPALTRARIPLMVVGTANSVSVAEQALFLMMALAKQGVIYDREVRAGNWGVRPQHPSYDLAEKTLLILGYGRIGRRLAKRAKAFEMTVLVYDPYVDEAEISQDGCRPVADLRIALAQADFLSVHTPLTDETRGMIGEGELALMKSTAYVVNTARGGIIAEKALHGALKSRRIAGAGLDVFDVEPVPADNPLLTLPNVIISPHVAGVSEESRLRMAMAAVKNVLDGMDGKPDPAMCVNKEVLQ
jgi:D-3-phosphoglycerate dehydrogenase / 2-oxoglutarate reductase